MVFGFCATVVDLSSEDEAEHHGVSSLVSVPPRVPEQDWRLKFSELKGDLCLSRQGASPPPRRGVEKEPEGKKCNVLMASGPAGKIKCTAGFFLLILHFQRLIVGVCRFYFLS